MESEGFGRASQEKQVQMKDVINTIKLCKDLYRDYGICFVVAYLYERYIVSFWTAVFIHWVLIVMYLKVRRLI